MTFLFNYLIFKTHLLAAPKSMQVLLLNKCNILELSGLFVCLGGLVKFFSAWGDRKNCLVVVFKGGIIYQADAMVPKISLHIFAVSPEKHGVRN